MKTIWTKETPTEDGYYWVRYGRGQNIRKEPCEVIHVGKETLVTIHRYGNLYEGLRHGGAGLKGADGKIVKSIRFGPEILIPS